MSDIHIRPITSSEWTSLRDLRLLAVRTNPGVYSTTYENVAARTESEWKALIEGSDRQIFGLFDDQRLIGITGVFTDSQDPSGGTAILVMSFILPEYRGKGLSKLFYEARLNWIQSRPQFTKVVVSHRKSNEASRRANQRHGFQFVKTVPRTWPDGITEDELIYETTLKP